MALAHAAIRRIVFLQLLACPMDSECVGWGGGGGGYIMPPWLCRARQALCLLLHVEHVEQQTQTWSSRHRPCPSKAIYSFLGTPPFQQESHDKAPRGGMQA